MTQNRMLSVGGRLLAALLFLALLLSVSLPKGQLTAQTQPVPDTTADAARGLQIYQARCANCHGPTGGGDGPLAGESPQPPAVFSDPAYRLTAVPGEMYLAIFGGRMEQGMPGFGTGNNSNPLSDQEIWDAIAAIYTFSTPADSLETGAALFDEYVTDTGDLDLTDPAFWATQSNDSVLATLQDAEIIPADADLSETDLQAIVDYARTFSYEYADPLAAVPTPEPTPEAIAAAVIGGEVINGSTNEPVGDLTVLLRAFTRDVQETLTLSQTVGIDGTYSFDLTDVPTDWIYLITAEYNGFRFNSEPSILPPNENELSLGVTVFDPISDPSVVSLGQIHTILNFANEEQVQISQLYRFNNSGNGLYVGTSGEPENGTIEIVVPTGAQNVNFQRGFGDLSSFTAAPEMIQTDTGWADTLPLRPGQGSLDLLVNYTLPYENGMRVAHPINYPVSNATAILQDVGVTLAEGGWQLQGEQAMGPNATFLNYANPSLATADALNFTLNGRPRITAAPGGAVAPQNQTMELIIGGIGLLVVVGAAVYMVSVWRGNQDDDYYEELEELEPDELVQAIAELDDAYENGEVDEADYEEERAILKEILMEKWADDA